MQDDRELDWEDEFIDDVPDFALLKAGRAMFEVKSVDKARYIAKQGSKIPDCNKAVVNLKVFREDEGETHISSNFYLHTKCKSFISEFFESVGLHKRGDKLRMRWGEVAGLTGECEIKVRTWQKDNGETGEINEVKKFYRPKQKSEIDKPSFQEPDQNQKPSTF